MVRRTSPQLGAACSARGKVKEGRLHENTRNTFTDAGSLLHPNGAEGTPQSERSAMAALAAATAGRKRARAALRAPQAGLDYHRSHAFDCRSVCAEVRGGHAYPHARWKVPVRFSGYQHGQRRTI